jgi:hypothetical protein
MDDKTRIALEQWDDLSCRAMDEAKLGRDVFVALAALGWADGKLHPDEADAIVRTALEEGLDIEEIEEIEKATKKRVELSAIDISKMSKADRLFVYAVGSWIVRLDGSVDESERQALDKLGEMLRIPERPREHAQKIAQEIENLAESKEPVFYNLPKLRRTLKVRLAQAQALRLAQKSDKKVNRKEDPESERPKDEGNGKKKKSKK